MVKYKKVGYPIYMMIFIDYEDYRDTSYTRL